MHNPERDLRLRSLAKAVEQIGDAVLIADAEGVVQYVNPAFEAMTGFKDADIVGRSPGVVKSGQHSPTFYEALWETIQRGDVFRAVFVNRRRDGEIYYEEKTISPIRSHSGKISHYISTAKDVTERIQTQQRLDYLANYDSLTGLPNRNLFMDRLKHGLTRAARQRSGIALFCLDIDRFKNINDSLGHAAGDEVLQAVGGRIANAVRNEDTVARLGGDEFTVIVEKFPGRDAVETVAQKIVAAFDSPFAISGKSLGLTGSIGISLYPDDGADPTTLLQHADLAMYRAKTEGRNAYRFFAPEMVRNAVTSLDQEIRLRGARERNELRLFYQPQIDLSSGAAVAVEALLRWDDPERGLLAPRDFLPLAEEMGLMDELNRWVIRTACVDATGWLAEGHAPLRVAVNLPGRQVQSHWLGDYVRTVLGETGLSGQLLEIEITERTLMENAAASELALRELTNLGVSVAIDNFGTGYSSLGYLTRFPIHALKIDRSFVSDIGKSEEGETAVRAIVSLARSLGLSVIAEGVETGEQLAFMRGEDCNLMQGFLFAQPMSAKEIGSYLAHSGRAQQAERGPAHNTDSVDGDNIPGT